MIVVDQLPVYEPEFKRRSVYRMSVLRWFDGEPGPRGGLAVVWYEGETPAKGFLVGRRPAVMELPEMWMSYVATVWKHFPPQDYDQTWTFTDSSMAYSSDHENVRALGGDWLPARGNLLMKMAKSKSPQARAIAADTSTRCFELLGEHDMACPYWLKCVPTGCKRCGGTGNIGLISSVRCPEC